MALQDQTLQCRDCGNQFTWTGSEQEFYQSKGFDNPPVRCPDCRAKRKATMHGGGGGDRGPRPSFEITCGKCGKTDTVPFQPRGDKEVLCRDCFRSQRDQQ